MRGLLTLGLLSLVLLTACSGSGSPTAQVVSAPVRVCSVPGFTCNIVRNGATDVGLMLRNNMGTDLSSVTVEMVTEDCELQKKIADAGRMPAGAATPVHYTCTTSVPSSFTAQFTVTYATHLGKETSTSKGVVTIRG